MENPYGVKIFQNFHFQKHPPIILKTLAKKKFQKYEFPYFGFDFAEVRDPQ